MTSFVTNDGLAEIVSELVAAGSIVTMYWGTGSGQDETSADIEDTASDNTADGTSSQQTTEIAGDTYRVSATIVATEAEDVTEVGLYRVSGSDFALVVYGDFDPISVAVGDTISFTIDVVFDQA